MQKLFESTGPEDEENEPETELPTRKQLLKNAPSQRNANLEDASFNEDLNAVESFVVSSEQLAKPQVGSSWKHLIENQSDFYRSIGHDSHLKTSLLVNRPGSSLLANRGVGTVQFDDSNGRDESIIDSESEVDPSELLEIGDDDDHRENEKPTASNAKDEDLPGEQGAKLIKTVKQMASILVKSAINLALSDVKSKAITDQSRAASGRNIEKMYRYCFSAKSKSEQSNSRLGYYKEFKTRFDSQNEEGEEEREDKFMIEFEDEPYELNDPEQFDESFLRKTELENFKNFLTENDAMLFFKLWVDIERLNTIFEDKEKAA